MTTKTDKALDLFNLLRQARDETLPAIFEAKAKAETARAVQRRMMAFDGCGDGTGNNDVEHVTDWAMTSLADECFAADTALDDAINAMVERNAAMWEAHAEFRRLYDAEKPSAKLASVN